MRASPRRLLSTAVNKAGNLLLSPPHGGFGYYRNHGPREHRQIALTFDDGPNEPSTAALLDLMGELNVRGTFFCVGENVRLNPHLVLRAYQEGHAIGNHSLAHRRTAALRPGGAAIHIDGGAAAIREVLGLQPRLYRPPWGWLTPWEGRRLRARGYNIVGWDIYTLDWQLPEPDSAVIVADALRRTRPGSILLFHDGVPNTAVWHKRVTVDAIRALVPALRDEGYSFVTIPELLSTPAYEAP